MGGFFSGLWVKLCIVLGIVLAALALVAKLMAAGRDQERAAQAKREFQMRRKGDEIERKVDAAGRTELDGLRTKWTRPE